ncbi:ABC transporter permease [Fretibacterium sp. OH1220_COT-178]|uniref:ABC transporter permease n=1 Tax=Fretibacterium sp. OH1220_COT-178 TaxID=2491047 RepID=UPI000F5FD12F|nr:ABC transporter permease [Fretibacterium sp. OH1220_COT-178]RRD64009.1 multidrug ABC transporter permease [Fretibacterium sp. OH1220_COT-178]
MKKYRSVMKAYLKGSLMNLMEYKFNFVTGGTFELVWTAMYVIFINVVFAHTKEINGWNKVQMLMLTFQGGLMDSTFTFLIVPGLRRLPDMVNTGALDFVLLKPINKRFNISCSEFDIPQIKNIALNAGGIAWCLSRLEISPTPAGAATYLLLSLNGFLSIYSIMFLLMSLSFWFVRMDIVMGIGSELITVGNKPMTIYPQAVQKILIFVIPLLVCFNFPILFVIRGLSPYCVLYSFLSTFIVFRLSGFVFDRGLRRYVGAGS